MSILPRDSRFAPLSSIASRFSVMPPYCCTCFTAALFAITSSTDRTPSCVRIDSRQFASSAMREKNSSAWCWITASSM